MPASIKLLISELFFTSHAVKTAINPAIIQRGIRTAKSKSLNPAFYLMDGGVWHTKSLDFKFGYKPMLPRVSIYSARNYKM